MYSIKSFKKCFIKNVGCESGVGCERFRPAGDTSNRCCRRGSCVEYEFVVGYELGLGGDTILCGHAGPEVVRAVPPDIDVNETIRQRRRGELEELDLAKSLWKHWWSPGEVVPCRRSEE